MKEEVSGESHLKLEVIFVVFQAELLTLCSSRLGVAQHLSDAAVVKDLLHLGVGDDVRSNSTSVPPSTNIFLLSAPLWLGCS